MDEPNLGERVVEAFGHMDLYVILGVDKAATAAQLKKGYLRACLACHPDKQGDKDSAEAQAAQRKFVLLSAVHELLSDARRRQQYDETGEVSEADSAEFVRWEQYWRAMFPAVTQDGIESFRATYQSNSDGEEERDVLAAYVASEGDMDAVIDSVMLADSDDIGRFVQSYVLPAIARGAVKRFRALKKFEKRPVKTIVAPPAQGRSVDKNNDDSDNTLVLAMRARKAANDKLIEGLERKYAPAGKRSEPTEEEFAALQADMNARREKKRRNRSEGK